MLNTLNCTFYTLQSVPSTSELLTLIPSCLQLQAPENVERVDNHFILLLDISESMNENHKLDNCKRCISLLLDFMTEKDCLSLVTFGSEAKILVKGVSMTETQKTTIRGVINSLYTNGNTNLSAGLACIEEVCRDTISLPQKMGLLLLTDGYANMGSHNTNALRGMMGTLCGRYPNLSVNCVAYGKTHNTELLQSIAQDCQGAYNIVDTIEDAAFAFGETLGGLMSCAYQNVVVKAPLGTIVQGLYKVSTTQDYVEISLGDVYAGTKPMILMDIPSTAFYSSTALKVCGCQMSTLRLFEQYPVPVLLTERNQDVDLTRLRYKCTDILKRVRDMYDVRRYNQHIPSERETILGQITTLETELQDPFLANHPVQRLLMKEIETLRSMLDEIRSSPSDVHVIASQHLTTLGLSRGFSTPHHATHQRRFHRQNALQILTQAEYATDIEEEEENPNIVTNNQSMIISSEPTSFSDVDTTFQSRLQSEVASLMRTRSRV